MTIILPIWISYVSAGIFILLVWAGALCLLIKWISFALRNRRSFGAAVAFITFRAKSSRQWNHDQMWQVASLMLKDRDELGLRSFRGVFQTHLDRLQESERDRN